MNYRYDLPTNTGRELNIIHTNCQSAMNKRSEVSDLIDSQKPQVLALTEFGASKEVEDSELNIDGYTLYRGNHSDGRGGLGKGAALYVHNTLNHSPCPNLENIAFDCSTWSLIKLEGNKRLLIGVVYRSPNSSDENNTMLMNTLRIAVNMGCEHLMVCGDFNLPRIDWRANQSQESDTSYSTNFVSLIEDLNLFQHAQESTRFRGDQNSCLDLVFTNEEHMVNEIRELPPIGKSDHVCQQWTLTVKEMIFKSTQARRHNFKRANWTGIKNDLRNYRNDPNDPPGVMYDKFVEKMNEAKTRHIPLCQKKSSKHRLPWMKGAKMKDQRSARWRSWTRFKKTGLPRDYDAYKLERNRLTDMIRSAKTKYESKLITDMKHNPNLYHGHCRRSLKTKQGVSNIINENGIMTENEQDTANAFNIYYHSVFTRDDEITAPPEFATQTDERITDVAVTVDQVKEVLTGLNPNKAAGPDGVENRILKECAGELAPILQQIYQKSLDEAEVPAQWKEANVVPIHKKGSKACMANFRPVALTSVSCKVLERILCSAIMGFLTTNNLISQQQHGFLRGRSCQTNILLCLEKWTEAIDNGKSIDVAYFDYAKAFDKVSHGLLLIKLKAYGIDGALLAWLTAYLKERKQRVVVGDAKSPWLEVVSGTTQGTVLGFLLFLIFINDLPSKCSPENESLVMLLADDTKSFQEMGNEQEQQIRNQSELQERVNRIAEWASEWKMEINAQKSKVMHIGKNNPGLPYSIEGTQIEEVTSEKDIGFWITDDLSTTTHIQKARCKALGEISRIRRNFSYIDKRAFCILYNQRIRPHLDYGMAACPPNTMEEAKKLEAVQSKATALVFGLKTKNSEERRKELKLMSLEERRERGDLIEVFKILKGLTKIDPADFWEVREARNGARLVKELAANGRRQRQQFFSYRVIQKWNLLPADIKTAPSLNSFKSRLDAKIMAAY